MRAVHCLHCKAINRRPKCGSCHQQITDPAAIEFAWKLYEQRRYVGIALVVTVLALILWRPWETFYLFSPTDFSECREQAARTGRSKEAMWVLIDICRTKFPKG